MNKLLKHLLNNEDAVYSGNLVELIVRDLLHKVLEEISLEDFMANLLKRAWGSLRGKIGVRANLMRSQKQIAVSQERQTIQTLDK